MMYRYKQKYVKRLQQILEVNVNVFLCAFHPKLIIKNKIIEH